MALWWLPKDPPMFLVTFATLAAVIVYVCLTKQQVDATNNASLIANRPYVIWIKDYPIKSELKKWVMNTQLRNFGKTPAIDAKMRFCDPIISDNPPQPSFLCTAPNPPISHHV